MALDGSNKGKVFNRCMRDLINNVLTVTRFMNMVHVFMWLVVELYWKI